MNARALFISGVSSAVLLFGAACGSDSTGPGASRLAQHFDSLYIAAAASSTIPSTIRAQVISDFEIPTAFGAVPREMSVTTAHGNERWKGIEFMINPGGGQFEFNDIVAVYRDADVHTALILSYGPDRAITSASLLVNDTVRFISSDISGSSSLSSVEDGCATPPDLMNPILGDYALAECASAEFVSSASADFTIDPGVDPALAHLAFGSTDFSGETFTGGFTDTEGRRVHGARVDARRSSRR